MATSIKGRLCILCFAGKPVLSENSTGTQGHKKEGLHLAE